MRSAAIALLVTLAACGAPTAPPAEDSERETLMGHYKAASDTARQVTGDVMIERGGLIFAKGAILYTRVLQPRRGSDLISRNGDSYAAIALGPADLRIELRRVLEQRVAEGARGVCGDTAPTYAALAHEERATTVTLMVFSGDEPPGPDATESRLCATFAFTAPEGARTRQGVVL